MDCSGHGWYHTLMNDFFFVENVQKRTWNTTIFLIYRSLYRSQELGTAQCSLLEGL